METVTEFFQSIYDSYTDRIKSPFIGSFLISFFFFNWRVFAILFYSEWPMHCRIEWIEEKYCTIGNFLYPVGIALFYILILPHINLLFDLCLSYYSSKKYSKKKKKRIADLEREKDEATLIREIADTKAGISEIINLKERNESLQHENTALTTQNQEDLQRHNKALDQSKTRESSYINQIRIYSVQNSLIFDSTLSSREDATFQNIKDMITIGDGLSDVARKNFTKFVLNFRNSIEVVTPHDLIAYEKLGLVRVNVLMNETKTHITPMGNLLYEYLLRGFDLL